MCSAETGSLASPAHASTEAGRLTPVASLSAGTRRGHVRHLGLLALLTIGEAVLAGQLASALERLVAGDDGVMLPLLAAGGIAAMSGAALLLLVWEAEDFANGSAGAQGEGHG